MHLVLVVGIPRGACKQASERAGKVKGAESWVRDREIAFSGPIQRLNYLTFS